MIHRRLHWWKLLFPHVYKWSESYKIYKVWLWLYCPLLQQCIGHLAYCCPLLTISSYSSQIPKSPFWFVFFFLPAVLFCHAHFKIYLFFQSDGPCLQAKHHPPALSRRTGAKKAKSKFFPVSAIMQRLWTEMTTVTFGKQDLVSNSFSKNWKEKQWLIFSGTHCLNK